MVICGDLGVGCLGLAHPDCLFGSVIPSVILFVAVHTGQHLAPLHWAKFIIHLKLATCIVIFDYHCRCCWTVHKMTRLVFAELLELLAFDLRGCWGLDLHVSFILQCVCVCVYYCVLSPPPWTNLFNSLLLGKWSCKCVPCHGSRPNVCVCV